MSSLAIPDNVKEVISRLSVQDQIIIRSYIAGMRDELKELRAKLEHGHDGDDPHAHYHGHEKCTSDHGHKHHDHDDDDKKCCDGMEEDEGHSHEHKHEHGHEHGHKHEHDHNHHNEEEEEAVPAWKKIAMDADPNAAPFGGSWNTESSMAATK